MTTGYLIRLGALIYLGCMFAALVDRVILLGRGRDRAWDLLWLALITVGILAVAPVYVAIIQFALRPV